MSNVSEFCVCAEGVANNEGVLGSCSVCNKMTEKVAVEYSLKHWKDDVASREYAAYIFEFIKEHGNMLREVIDFYAGQDKYAQNLSGDTLDKLKYYFSNIDTAIVANTSRLQKSMEHVNDLVEKVKKYEGIL